MGPPGGGRMVISPRIQSRFNLINMTFPHVSNQIYKILISQNSFHLNFFTANNYTPNHISSILKFL